MSKAKKAPEPILPKVPQLFRYVLWVHGMRHRLYSVARSFKNGDYRFLPGHSVWIEGWSYKVLAVGYEDNCPVVHVSLIGRPRNAP